MTCIWCRIFGVLFVVVGVLVLLSYMGLIQYHGPPITPHVSGDRHSPTELEDVHPWMKLSNEELKQFLLKDVKTVHVKRMEPEDIKFVMSDFPLLKKMKEFLEMRSSTNFVAHPELATQEPLSLIMWATNRDQTKRESGRSSFFGFTWPSTTVKQEHEVVFMFNARVAGVSEETVPMVLQTNWRPHLFGPLEKKDTPKVIEVVFETVIFSSNLNDLEIVTMHRWFEVDEAADLLKLMELCRPNKET